VIPEEGGRSAGKEGDIRSAVKPPRDSPSPARLRPRDGDPPHTPLSSPPRRLPSTATFLLLPP